MMAGAFFLDPAAIALLHTWGQSYLVPADNKYIRRLSAEPGGVKILCMLISRSRESSPLRQLWLGCEAVRMPLDIHSISGSFGVSSVYQLVLSFVGGSAVHQPVQARASGQMILPSVGLELSLRMKELSPVGSGTETKAGQRMWPLV
jgi:hypothetical protein